MSSSPSAYTLNKRLPKNQPNGRAETSKMKLQCHPLSCSIVHLVILLLLTRVASSRIHIPSPSLLLRPFAVCRCRVANAHRYNVLWLSFHCCCCRVSSSYSFTHPPILVSILISSRAMRNVELHETEHYRHRMHHVPVLPSCSIVHLPRVHT